MSSLREALSSALEASEAGTLPAVADTPIEAPVETAPVETAQAKAERTRDDGGRFAAKPAEVAQTEAAQPVTRKPPSAWKKDHWERWAELKPETQDYIDQRENEAAKGVSTYKQQYEQVAPIYRALEPHLPSLQQRGLTPDRFIQDLAHVDRVLTTGSLAEKTQLIHRMAAQNGIHLGVPQGQGDPQIQYALQNQQQLEQRMRAFENAQAQESAAAAQRQIDQFSVDKPHFEKVKGEMGRLLQSGFATDLDSAYERAIWSDPEIRQELVTQQAAPVNRAAQIAQKKAAASSPKSASPTGALAAGNGKKSLRETLSEAMDSVTGRV